MHSSIARLAKAAFVIVFVGCGSTSSPSAKQPTNEKVAPDSEYDRLCTGIAPEHRAKCPIGAWTQSAEDVEGGVVLHLNAAAPRPGETEKRMRCHRAWMAHDPSNAMPRCPLGSPGITITAKPGAAGTDLLLLASRGEDIEEVRKRTHAALGK